MEQVFISHVAEDGALALRLAQGLEAAGYATWYYERNSLPGPSYLEQILAALDHSGAVVALVSPAALASGQVDKEVVQAHERGLPFLPLLRGLTYDQLHEQRPAWAMAFGAAVALPLPSDDVAAVLPQLVAGLRWLAGKRSSATSAAPEPAARGPNSSSSMSRIDNLPLPPTPLLGREQAVAQLVALLRQPAVRLVTLTGPGGVGKTRVALAVAQVEREAFADGASFVDLAPLADAALVPSAIAHALGVTEVGGQPLAETLRAALRGRALLLVVDNFEQVAEAAALVADLLASCPRLMVLATSRLPLHLRGEREIVVPPLAVPDVAHLPAPDALAQVPAVALFVQRAQEARAAFVLSEANAAAVAQICARLDGLPLAIELAAARVGALSVQTIAARLDDRFALLTGGARDALPRQQTLRATMDWSYELLRAGERVLLERLSVFAGGWTLEAAEAICAGDGLGAEEVLDLLDGLVHRSLVQAEEQGAGELRYGLLETIREYGQERLAARGEAEAAAVRQRHAAHYLALVEEAAPYLNKPGESAWLARLDVELDNMRAALRWFLDRGDAAEGLRLASALLPVGGYWYKRNALAEGSAWLTRLLALPDAVLGVPRAQALIVEGRSAKLHAEAAYSRQQLEEALALGRRLADRDIEAQALLWLGVLATWQGEDRQARVWLEECLALFRALGDAADITEALCNLSRALTRMGEPALARARLDEALAIARVAGELRHVAFVLEVGGEVAFTQGDDAEAGRLWQECLARYRALSFGIGIFVVESFLGQLALRQGDRAAARMYFSASLAHQQGGPARYWTMGTLAGLAAVAAAEGQAARALRLAGVSAALGKATGLSISPAERETMERTIASSRAALGARQADVEWAAGQTLQLQQAIAYALEPEASGHTAPDGEVDLIT